MNIVDMAVEVVLALGYLRASVLSTFDSRRSSIAKKFVRPPRLRPVSYEDYMGYVG